MRRLRWVLPLITIALLTGGVAVAQTEPYSATVEITCDQTQPVATATLVNTSDEPISAGWIVRLNGELVGSSGPNIIEPGVSATFGVRIGPESVGQLWEFIANVQLLSGEDISTTITHTVPDCEPPPPGCDCGDREVVVQKPGQLLERAQKNREGLTCFNIRMVSYGFVVSASGTQEALDRIFR